MTKHLEANDIHVTLSSTSCSVLFCAKLNMYMLACSDGNLQNIGYIYMRKLAFSQNVRVA